MPKLYPKFSDAQLDSFGLSRSLIPRHVGVIMDGNGRWAKKRLLPRSAGHRAGMEALRGVVRFSHSLGVEALTVYAFSTENWRRPRAEVDALFALLEEYFYKEIDELHLNGVRIMLLGDLAPFSDRLRRIMETAITKTEGNTGLSFNIALNYGGRAELVHAAKRLIADGLCADELDEAALCSRLYTAGLPEVDMIIRTAGEKRLSNFLLWQAAYSELLFTDTLFPDFDNAAYVDCLVEYAGRTRRFGKVL